jgi:hypothetical protein
MAPPLKVDPPHLKAIAERTEAVADGVDRVEATVTRCAPRGVDVFGTPAVAEAYHRFHARWSAELRVTGGATRQLADGLLRAAGGYQAADDDAGRRFR